MFKLVYKPRNKHLLLHWKVMLVLICIDPISRRFLMINILRRFTCPVTVFAAAMLALPCAAQTKPTPINLKALKAAATRAEEPFQWQVDQFADVKILRYRVDGFEKLSLKQKKLVYFLGEASKAGRDIAFDQMYKHNLVIRHTLDAIVDGYQGDRTTPEWQNFMTYVKRVWFSHGIHHHYSNDKFIPEFSKEYFAQLIEDSDSTDFPIEDDQCIHDLIEFLEPILFDPKVDPKKIYSGPGDLVTQSAINFYEGVTQEEVEAFYKNMMENDPAKATPISYGLNTRLIKRNGKVVEQVAKAKGLYGSAIRTIIYWLERASDVAESDHQKKTIKKLIEYYRTGNLKKFDEFNILWVADNKSEVDFVNGFTEVYDDPLGRKGTWEGLVNFKDVVASQRLDTLTRNAQWFEDNSPVSSDFKKKEVKGVTAKVINAAMLGGSCYPSSPLGINLPNSNWIREKHGSKSVTIANISYANSQASTSSGFGAEFCYSAEELERSRQHGALAGTLHTDMHEVLGHGSGKLMPGVTGDSLKEYHSPIEEARADLFALYYLMDPKLVEMGLLSSPEVAKAGYDSHIRNGLLTQITRILPGKSITQAHMKSRSLVSRWVYEQGLPERVITKEIKDGKTYFVINDYQKLRDLFGKLLAKVQEITSKGQYEEAKALVESYGVKVDPELHKEVLERYAKLKLAPYTGFVNPEYIPVYRKGKLVNFSVYYPNDYVEQMMGYGQDYSTL